MAGTADIDARNFDKWGRPNWAQFHPNDFDRQHHGWRPGWHPGMILLTVAGFIVWWPLGLAALAFSLWSRKMGCWNHHDRHERWANKMDRMRSRFEGRGFSSPSSGNHAFDEYRLETLRRLEEEQSEFHNFLDRLRHAKDKQEFDEFMAQHKTRPAPANDQPQG